MADRGWDIEVDVVCAGSGIGGLAAAVVAAEAGARVLVVEKAATVGGVTAYSLGELWLGGTRHEVAAGIVDSVDDTVTYMEFLAAGFGDPELRRAYVERGNAALAWFERTIGFEVELIRGFADYYYPDAPGSRPEGRFLEPRPFDGRRLGEWAGRASVSPFGTSMLTHEEMFAAAADPSAIDVSRITGRIERDERCMGGALAGSFLLGAIERGVEIWTESPLAALLGDGEVTGAVVATPRGEVRVRAKAGVVLATGAYDWNESLVASFEHVPELHSMVPPTIEGDHLRVAAPFGAGIVTIPTVGVPQLVGVHVPGETHGGKPLYRPLMIEAGRPHSVIVNRSGERFADESFYHDVAAGLHVFDGRRQRQPNWPAWLVVDGTFRERYGLAGLAAGQPLPDGLGTTADSLEELAAKAGIDADGLRETVDRFNRFCDAGVDTDFRRGGFPWSNFMCGDLGVTPNPNLGPLSRPPYSAVPLTLVAAGIPSAGLHADADGRVLDFSGAPIPGLHAAGNAVGYRDIGCGYQSGMANMRGMTLGHSSGMALTAR